MLAGAPVNMDAGNGRTIGEFLQVSVGALLCRTARHHRTLGPFTIIRGSLAQLAFSGQASRA